MRFNDRQQSLQLFFAFFGKDFVVAQHLGGTSLNKAEVIAVLGFLELLFGYGFEG